MNISINKLGIILCYDHHIIIVAKVTIVIVPNNSIEYN